jgi:hypothetical protein
MYDAVQQRRRGPGTERALTRSRERDHGSQVEHIARRPDLEAHGLLG